MALVQTQLTFNSLNISTQIGDLVYFTTGGGPLGGFNQADTVNTVLLGQIVFITGNSITVEYDDIIIPDTSILIGSYISFAKNKIVNTSSLLGYYAEMIFINEDNEKKVELFSVGSEIEESSK